jgi:signal transduction histidine kinase
MRLTLSSARSPIRAALIAGFAVVFALWFGSGYELVRNIRDVEQRMAEARQTFLRGEVALTKVSTNVLLGSIYLRDALMTPTMERREHYRQELLNLRSEVDRALPDYLSLVDTPLEREQVARLRVELDAYWNSREIVFAINPQSAPAGAGADLIRSRVAPARESILQIVDSLSALERASIDSHEAEAAQFYRDAERRVTWLASLALVAALLTAFIAARHVGRLEREIGRRQRAEHHNRLDLERLSARLVNAQEEERRSLARELHDAVGQALTAIKMEMGVALRGVEADARARTALEQARAIAESTLQSVRDLSQVLHPSMLDDFGLPEAVRGYLRGFSKRANIRAQLTHERMNDRLPADVEVCVYRIVQEALTNVAHHSGATSCTVSLIRRENVLHLTVEDDGRGLAPTARTPDARRGLGLIGMRERAQNLSGTFIIENRAEGGTRVVVKLPVPAVVDVDRQEQLAG